MSAHHSFPFFDLESLNDLTHPEKSWAIETMITNGQPTLSFFVLLVGSTSICTLGLLQNNASVIIGGMIISPMMWPLLLVGLGISSNRTKLIKKALLLLVASITLVLLSASLIVLVSPIKSLTAEILSRAEPTFFDLVVALIAGAVAALAMLHKRISATLAGVAIATSLLPPLCVGAIGLALGDLTIARNSFLLFLSSVTAIIFIAALLFSTFGLRDQRFADKRIRNMLIVLAVLVVVANPMISLLKVRSFQLALFPTVSSTLQKHFETEHPQAQLLHVAVDSSAQNKTVKVTAQVVLPERDEISFSEQQEIIALLEKQTRSTVDLSLVLQRSISILSQTDAQRQAAKQRLELTLSQAVAGMPDIEVDAITVDFIEKPTAHWYVSAILRTTNLDVLDDEEYQKLKTQLQDVANESVSLKIELIPRKIILGEQNAGSPNVAVKGVFDGQN